MLLGRSVTQHCFVATAFVPGRPVSTHTMCADQKRPSSHSRTNVAHRSLAPTVHFIQARRRSLQESKFYGSDRRLIVDLQQPTRRSRNMELRIAFQLNTDERLLTGGEGILLFNAGAPF